jgi:hypothetical protein
MRNAQENSPPAVVTKAITRYIDRCLCEDDLPPPAYVTLYVSTSDIAKRYELSRDGKSADGSGTRAKLRDAWAYRLPVIDLKDFAALREDLGAKNALSYGLFEKDRVHVTEEWQLGRKPESVARMRRFMSWPCGPAVMMNDIDLQSDEHMTPAEFDAFMCSALEWWHEPDRMYCYSSSSGIARESDGKLLKDYRNFRVYLVVDDGRAIPRLGMQIHDALWRAGKGRLVIGDAGQVLDRALADYSVHQPERLDFIRPSLGHGMTVKQQEPIFFEGGQ